MQRLRQGECDLRRPTMASKRFSGETPPNHSDSRRHLTMTIDLNDQVATIVLDGRADAPASEHLRLVAQAAFAVGMMCLRFDCTDLAGTDATPRAILTDLCAHAANRHGAIIIHNPPADLCGQL